VRFVKLVIKRIYEYTNAFRVEHLQRAKLLGVYVDVTLSFI